MRPAMVSVALTFVLIIVQLLGCIPSPTPTPTSVVEPKDLVHRQLLATTSRWTKIETFGLSCNALMCNQDIYVSFTLVTPELITDMAKNNLAEKNWVSKAELDKEVKDLNTRLRTDDAVTFLMTITPITPTLPVPIAISSSGVKIGPLRDNLKILRRQKSYAPLDYSSGLDTNISLAPLHRTEGYLFFPKDAVNMNEASDVSVQLSNVDKVSWRGEAVWNFDLISSHSVPPWTPTPIPPTPDPKRPTPTPGPDRGDQIFQILVNITDVLAKLL